MSSHYTARPASCSGLKATDGTLDSLWFDPFNFLLQALTSTCLLHPKSTAPFQVADSTTRTKHQPFPPHNRTFFSRPECFFAQHTRWLILTGSRERLNSSRISLSFSLDLDSHVACGFLLRTPDPSFTRNKRARFSAQELRTVSAFDSRYPLRFEIWCSARGD